MFGRGIWWSGLSLNRSGSVVQLLQMNSHEVRPRRAGGVYTEGAPIRNRDIATQCLRLILGVIGITDVTFIAAGGAKAVDPGEVGREDFLNKFQGEIEARAA